MHPILCRVGGAAVTTYGVLVSAGYLVGVLWLMRKREELKGTWGEFWALCYAIFAGALIGAKLGFIVVEWRDFAADPWEMLSDWRTGWVFWSGFAGTMLAGWVYQRVYNRLYRPRRYLPVADYFGVALPMGHAVGRLGCLAEGCCHGRPTAMPWGVVFADPGSSVSPGLLGVPLHPTQLYEAFGEAVLCAFLMFYVMPRIRRKRFTCGTAFFAYIVLYSVLRFTVECFRGDDRGVFLSPVLSPSQWASLAGLAAGGFLLWRNGVIERHPARRSLYL